MSVPKIGTRFFFLLLFLPLRLDMILFVCCFSLFVCVLNLWAYRALDILFEDNPRPNPKGVGAAEAGVRGTEMLPETEILLLFGICCWTMGVIGGWVFVKWSVVGTFWLGVATVEAAVRVSTFSWNSKYHQFQKGVSRFEQLWPTNPN